MLSATPPLLTFIPVLASTTSAPSPPSAARGASEGVVIGLVIGGLAAVAVVGVLIGRLVCRRRARSAQALIKYLGADNVSEVTSKQITFGGGSVETDATLSSDAKPASIPPSSCEQKGVLDKREQV